jgi:hypothetical protein
MMKEMNRRVLSLQGEHEKLEGRLKSCNRDRDMFIADNKKCLKWPADRKAGKATKGWFQFQDQEAIKPLGHTPPQPVKSKSPRSKSSESFHSANSEILRRMR